MRAVAPGAAFIVLVACSGGSVEPNVPTPTSILVSASTLTFGSLGESQQLTATVRDQGGSAISVTPTWASDNQSVATVSGSGNVTSAGNGTTTITVAAGSARTSVQVVVQQQSANITVSPASATLTSIGDSTRATVTALDARGGAITSPLVSWSSGSTSVASVSTSGVIKAVANGRTVVTASSGTVSGSITIDVIQRPNRLRLTPSVDTLAAPGATRKLVAALVDAGGTAMPATPAPTWSSDNVAVATVTSDGTVTAVALGTAEVSARADTFTARARIVVAGDQGDLDVGWIHRSPEMDFVVGSTNATRDGWPASGQTVTWEAKVKNWSAYTRSAVPYRWTVDGTVVGSGVVDMAARAYTTVSLSRPWSFTRSRLLFEIDPANQVVEVEERNNSVEVFTDAISLALYVEQSLYDYFAEFQKKLGVGSNSWEDWAQRHVRTWNKMFDDARYPMAPNGVLDRIRLDKIVIVPDGALPLAGGLPGNTPNLNDRTVDLQWGFPKSLLATGMYSNQTAVPGANNLPDNPFYYENSLLHELGHARYLVDVYGFNVLDGRWTPTGIVGVGTNVAIREGGALISGSPYMPIVAWEVLYYTPMDGLMSSDRYKVDEYNAAALNLIAGRRAVAGNTNAPGNIGIFLNDLPSENRLTVRDQTGSVLAGASVRIYRAAPKADEWYGKFFDDIPDMTSTASDQGQVLLGRNPFGGSSIVHTYGHSNGVVIVRVEKNGRVGYGFLESWRFNMEYWRGHTSMGDYTLSVTLR